MFKKWFVFATLSKNFVQAHVQEMVCVCNTFQEFCPHSYFLCLTIKLMLYGFNVSELLYVLVQYMRNTVNNTRYDGILHTLTSSKIFTTEHLLFSFNNFVRKN